MSVRCGWCGRFGGGFLFVALLVAAVVDCWIRRPKVGAEGAVWIHGWCRRIVRVLGFRCEVEGRVPRGRRGGFEPPELSGYSAV